MPDGRWGDREGGGVRTTLVSKQEGGGVGNRFQSVPEGTPMWSRHSVAGPNSHDRGSRAD